MNQLTESVYPGYHIELFGGLNTEKDRQEFQEFLIKLYPNDKRGQIIVHGTDPLSDYFSLPQYIEHGINKRLSQGKILVGFSYGNWIFKVKN